MIYTHEGTAQTRAEIDHYNEQVSPGQIYARELERATTELARYAYRERDPVILGAAEQVASLSEGQKVADALTTVVGKVASEAAFRANYHDGTGRGRREEGTFPHHIRRLAALTGADRIASEANMRARDRVANFVRAQQGPAVEVPQLYGAPSLHEQRPTLAEGANTVYQVATTYHGMFNDELAILIKRPVEVVDGQLRGNDKYPSADVVDYSLEQVQVARESLVFGWNAYGAGDGYRVRQKPVEDISDEEAIRTLHFAEKRLTRAIQENKMPGWEEGAAIAVVPNSATGRLTEANI